MLEAYSKRGMVSTSEATTMHGLLNYAGGFVVGPCLKPSSRVWKPAFGVVRCGAHISFVP